MVSAEMSHLSVSQDELYKLSAVGNRDSDNLPMVVQISPVCGLGAILVCSVDTCCCCHVRYLQHCQCLTDRGLKRGHNSSGTSSRKRERIFHDFSPFFLLFSPAGGKGATARRLPHPMFEMKSAPSEK